mmetsp:Transcript_4846/g.4093  ORF Transcript_4846/g.4093 Transcript_4846/m.4093 type:complete len:140 (+) Transcript_4846:48-467(+)
MLDGKFDQTMIKKKSKPKGKRKMENKFSISFFRQGRVDHAERDELYLWREDYPNSNDVYCHKSFEQKKEYLFNFGADRYVLDPVHPEEKGNIFTEGGMIFHSNPYTSLRAVPENYRDDLRENIYPQLQQFSLNDISLDD